MATNNQVNTSLSGQTGTGNFVGATSPTIVTPRIGTIDDTNGVSILNLQAVASAVNYLAPFNNVAGAKPGITMQGSDTDIGVIISAKAAGTFVFQSEATSNQYSFSSGTSAQHNSIFNFPSTSGNRTITWPDATGTLLMTGQAISTVPSIAFSSTSGVIGTTTNDNAAAGSVGEFVSSTVLAGA